MEGGMDPISSDEIVYRRILEQYYDKTNDALAPQAFRPVRSDTTGISVTRAKYATAEQAARGRGGKRYYIAALLVSDLHSIGLRIEPRPVPDNPGHAEIPELVYETRRSDRSVEWQQVLADKLHLEVMGPFPE